MIFDSLFESANRRELILLDGGMCHWHLRRDGIITLREIIVLPQEQRKGIGKKILNMLLKVYGAKEIIARCPEKLNSNSWYEHMQFKLIGHQKTRTGKRVNIWRLVITN